MSLTLLIDNYDSFTHNLAQLLFGLSEVRVVRNDEIDLSGIRKLAPSRVLLSPGPGHPERPRDFGVCADWIAAARAGERIAPTLGVCLGHQGIAHGFGAKVGRAPKVMHGKSSLVRHRAEGLFARLPNPFEAMRYHSLVVAEDSLPPCLEPLARTEDGVLMALRHRHKPLFGVQFHPESIGTPDGRTLLENFFSLTAEAA